MDFEYLDGIKEDIWHCLANADKKIVMYGTGNGADKIINIFNEYGIELYGIFASDDFARGQNFRGFTVKKYSDFENELDDFIVVVSFATQRKEVLSNIYRIAAKRELYAPDVPVFGKGLWTKDYFNEKREALLGVYNKLSDDISRKTFVSTIAYKLTGDIRLLPGCEETREEIYSLIKKLSNNRNYADIGAYTGDTIEEYTDYFGKDMLLYAFEPDEKNFKKMKNRLLEKGINCEVHNVAAWYENTILEFDARTGRSCSTDISNHTKSPKIKKVNAVRVDDIISRNIGYVKIDAEGADINVIEGMKRIIAQDKPVIKIAAYHRTEDYFAIPEAVSKINPNYKLYMRHLPYVPAWDTDFIFAFD